MSNPERRGYTACMKSSIAVLVLLLSCGCASFPGARGPEGGSVRLEAPFFPDDSGQGGPSALASVLSFWGMPAPAAELRNEVLPASSNGLQTVDLLQAAQSRGLWAEAAEGGLLQVKKELDAGRPVIAFVNTGFRFAPMGRYLVLTGYDEERRIVFAHSGATRDRPMSYAKFDRQWRKTGRWALAIRPRTPREQADSLIALGSLAFEEGHLDTAEAAFREALKAVPLHPVAARHLVMTILARDALEREGEPRPHSLDTPEAIQLRQRRYAEALELVDRAEGAAPPDDALVRGQLKKARDAIQAAAKERDHAPGQVPRK